MPARPWKASFTSGELTDQLLARVDWDKYANGAACLRNFVVRPQGGAARRAGTVYLGDAKFQDTLAHLKRFEFNVTQAYILEFGVGYIRFWANRGLVVDGASVPVEVATTYTEAELREIRTAQSADVQYHAHTSHAPAKLQRTSATAFTLSNINWLIPPTYEKPELPQDALTLTATTGTITVAAVAGTFLDGDVGRTIRIGLGWGVITAVSADGSAAQVDVYDAFPSTGPFAAGAWQMEGSPNRGTLDPDIKEPPFAEVTLTASLETWRAAIDVGKYVYLNDGLAQIIAVDSVTVARAKLLHELSVDTAAPAGSWTLESPQWSSANGYPGVVCFSGQRLWWFGSPTFPDRIWGSVVGDYENHFRGVADDDAVQYDLGSQGVNQIRWAKGLDNGLAVGTIASEFTILGANDEPLSPTNVLARERTKWGANYPVDAVSVDNAVLFLQRDGQRIREFVYNWEANREVAVDLTIIAEHIVRAGIVEMAVATQPDVLLFCVRQDGNLAVLTYERAQQVVGWSHQDTDGNYESVAVIPNSCGTGDEVWTANARSVVQGNFFATGFFATGFFATGFFAEGLAVTHRTIEVFDGNMNTDAGLVYSGAAASTFTGLDHLDGNTIKAIASDGTVYDLVVSGGSITLPGGASTTALEAGIHFISTVQTLRPELPTPAGSAQARIKHWNHVTARVYCTKGVLTLDGETMEYPLGTDLNATYTGDLLRKMNLGWNREGQLVIRTTEPKPCTILGLAGALQLEDA